jgi:two-component system, OmpR family, alkaline phosphatase synthesis response regulator PhoP
VARIIIVEDDSHLSQGLKYNFELEGFEVDIFPEAETALKVFRDYDMMILDVMLPGINGIEMLTIIRETDNKFPVLILSAKVMEEDRLAGLVAGADDYVTKPFSLPELIYRTKRILERRQWYSRSVVDNPRYEFDKYLIDFDTLEAVTPNQKKKLTLQEGHLLKYLIENKNRIIPREELLENVWGYKVAVETRTVDMFIARLRKLFESETDAQHYIKSLRGVGYGFFEEEEQVE